ncbi:MAG: hypothetical protein WCA83_10525 [Azonexus sp.]|jgi:hypothetical protein
MTAINDDAADSGANAATGSSDYSSLEPKFGAIYVVELCSGELRRWRYLGLGEQSRRWWGDMESGLEFNETSVMYAWRIVGEENLRPEQAHSVSLVQDNGS